MPGTVNLVKSPGGHSLEGATVVLLNGYTVQLPCRQSCLAGRLVLLSYLVGSSVLQWSVVNADS